jgi:precorrin-6B methylase 2
MAVPDRIRRAVAALGTRPGEHVLEIGCGPGVAVSLLCAAGVRVTALDRSPVAVARTRRRNAEHVEGGRAVVVCGALAEHRDGPLLHLTGRAE